MWWELPRSPQRRNCAEVIRELLDDAELLSGKIVATGSHAREGVGVIEAPRGTLIH